MNIVLNFLNKLTGLFSIEMPDNLHTLDQRLDHIIPAVVPKHGEDLVEEKYWLGKRWKEIREDATFHEAILHVFNAGGEYLMIIEGNILKGTWKKLGDYNSLVIEIAGRNELFDLQLLTNDFFVLSKHGDQPKSRKYFLMCEEIASKNPETGLTYDWYRITDKMFNLVRSDISQLITWIGLMLVIVAIVYVFSR